MPVQAPEQRITNFDEVALGFSMEDALVECARCLDCPEPACVAGCPVGIDIPGFIMKVADKDYQGAYDILSEANLLPAICGRVCPQEDQCEGVCPVGDTLEPVAIGRIERWVGDQKIEKKLEQAPPYRAQGRQGRHRRLRPRQHGLCGGSGQGRMRGDGVRGPA